MEVPGWKIPVYVSISLGTDANKCPAGSYCPDGTDQPELCPQGTFNPDPARSAISQCLDCTGGYYCNTTGKSINIRCTHD